MYREKRKEEDPFKYLLMLIAFTLILIACIVSMATEEVESRSVF